MLQRLSTRSPHRPAIDALLGALGQATVVAQRQPSPATRQAAVAAWQAWRDAYTAAVAEQHQTEAAQ